MKKRLIRVLSILLLLCMTGLPLSNAHAAGITTGMISGDDIALRKTASSSGSAFCYLAGCRKCRVPALLDLI